MPAVSQGNCRGDLDGSWSLGCAFDQEISEEAMQEIVEQGRMLREDNKR